eukprot:scaffold607_cov160-Ochromonas_danica.AAC.11
MKIKMISRRFLYSFLVITQLVLQGIIWAEAADSTNPVAFSSPSPGSAIEDSSQWKSLLACTTPGSCVLPALQLSKAVKVHVCQPGNNTSQELHKLVSEGLRLHGKVTLTASASEADYVFFVSEAGKWQESDCHSVPSQKLIVLHGLDDGGGHDGPPSYSMAFHRRYVVEDEDGDISFPYLRNPSIYPLPSAVSEQGIGNMREGQDRPLDIFSAISLKHRMGKWVKDYIARHASLHSVTAQQVGQNRQYGETQSEPLPPVTVARLSKVTLLPSPGPAHGPDLLWEAMGGGALVFSDPVFLPYPFPFRPLVHYLTYNHSSRADLWEELNWALSNATEATHGTKGTPPRLTVAIAGYLHALKYHRSVNLVDYVLRSAHLHRVAHQPKTNQRLISAEDRSVEHYTYTAQDLAAQTRVQALAIHNCRIPGVYTATMHHEHTLTC